MLNLNTAMENGSNIFVEGNPEKVFQEIYSFNDGHKDNIRPALIILGGAMRGIFGGGGAIALNEANLTNGFDTVIGVSTGAPVGAYFLSGEASVGTSIYIEECLTKNFMSISRFLFKAGKFLDIKYLGKLWSGTIGNKKLNIGKLKENKSKLLIAVTEFEKGEGQLMEMGLLEDPICAMVASCSIPFLTDTKVKCGDKYYTDGAMSLSFPVQETIAKVNPTSILVFPNRDITYKDSLLVLIWEWVVYHYYPHDKSKKFYFKSTQYEKELKLLREAGIPYAIVWGDNNLKAFTSDKKLLVQAMEKYKEFVANLARQFKPKSSL